MEYRPFDKYSPGIIKTKRTSNNTAEAIILSIIMLSTALVGGLYLKNRPGPPPLNMAVDNLCCDTGSGFNCHPQADKTLKYQDPKTKTDVTYGLLKSQITMNDCAKHLKDSGQTFNGHPIILDSSSEITHGPNDCGSSTADMLTDYRPGRATCVVIPDEELVYVCTQNCAPAIDTQCDKNAKDFYGSGSTVYDVYFRMNDEKNPGVPEVIRNCQGAWNPADNKSNQLNQKTPLALQTLAPNPPFESHHTEQLHTFQLVYSGSKYPQQWLRPWCKPAIYLYPTQTEKVHVAIAPQGKVLKTIPQYPWGGWDVTAHPDGKIDFNNASYDYLFYEASLPDELLSSITNDKKEGYVIKYEELSHFFDQMLPMMGLNPHEKQAFSNYWLGSLPKANYYYISIVPQSFLDTISPLQIAPTPDSMLRVNLSFEPVDKSFLVKNPTIKPFSRHGFSVIEWGGLFKQDKNHPFTCLM